MILNVYMLCQLKERWLPLEIEMKLVLCRGVCVCMYACECVCVYACVCMNVCMYACECVSESLCVRVCACVCVYVCVFV